MDIPALFNRCKRIVNGETFGAEYVCILHKLRNQVDAIFLQLLHFSSDSLVNKARTVSTTVSRSLLTACTWMLYGFNSRAAWRVNSRNPCILAMKAAPLRLGSVRAL